MASGDNFKNGVKPPLFYGRKGRVSDTSLSVFIFQTQPPYIGISGEDGRTFLLFMRMILFRPLNVLNVLNVASSTCDMPKIMIY